MSLLEKSSSIELSRRTQPFYAKKSSYGLGQQVQIEVDLQREFIDFENSRLVFEMNVGATVANSTTVAHIASQFIKNLRVKTLAGQMIGHEIREYRAWYQMMAELTSNSERNTSYDDLMEGANPLALAETTAIVIQYAHKFISHIFSIKEYYPAHFHQGIMIEFDLPSNIGVELLFEDGGGAQVVPTLTFDNCKYVADLVQLKPEIENEMVKMMEEQRLFADYEEVLTQENNLSTGGGQKAYDVVGIDGRVKSIFTYQILDADRTLADANDQYFGTWSRNLLGSYRYKLGANYLNYESINTNSVAAESQGAEATYELLKALDIHDSKKMNSQSGDSGLTRALLFDGRFVNAVKVDKAQKNSSQTISSMIDKDRNNVRVELNFDSTGPASTGTIYTHIRLDKRIQILPGSIVRNVRS